MQIEKFTFLSADKKTTIQAIKCIPKDGKYTKILQIVHGMHEYIEKYIPFMQYLSTFGFMTVGHDQLGHGNSILKEKDWGFFGEHPSDILVSDIHTIKKMIQEKNKNIPYFILGHSMGSFLLRKYLSFCNEGLDGAIIMGTGYTSPCVSRMGILLVKTIAFFRGGHYFSKKVDDLSSLGEAYKKYDLSGKDPYNSWLTKDPDEVRLRKQDPKVTFPFSVNGYLGVFEAVNFSCHVSAVQSINKNLPILLISGSDDPVGNNGKGVETVYQMMKSAGINDITMKLLENDRHEILQELDKENVFEEIRSWMDKKLPSTLIEISRKQQEN